jgi:uncharacterized membrane-anchored protein YitT (DUF2179 family)
MKSALPSLKIPPLTWADARDGAFIALGAALQAAAIRLFLVPSNLVNGGVAGLSQLINHYTGWPIGLMIFIGNVPLFILGWRHLGGPRFVTRTALAVILVSVFTDLFAYVLPKDGLTKEMVLNTLYGGLVSGVGFGLVYMGKGTSGGSDILARILRHWKGISLSQSYLVTDSAVMFLAGLAFSWDNALYALVMLYISGLAAEAVMGGSNVERTALIVTDHPRAITVKILEELERGVTILEGTGAYTGEEREILYVVISRSEVNPLKALVHEIDPGAFVVIGQAQEVMGEGFRSLAERT